MFNELASVLQIKTKIVSSNTADFKTVKQEVNSTVILPPLVFPGQCIITLYICVCVCVCVHARGMCV
jgi:hypothetical protein